ncbi:MAG TPA: hypothetical protein VGK94_13760 [Candidatus Polarisedimenticolia bacterium]
MLTREGVKAGASGIADQVALSATSLIVGLALASRLDPGSFGVYVIAVAVMLAGSSAQVSLVTDPLLILAAPRSGREQSRYLAALLWIQVLVSLAVAAAIAISGELLGVAWGSGSQIPTALIAAAASTVPIQLQAFFRAVLFSRLRATAVLFNDLLYCVLRLAGVGLLILADRLAIDTVLLVYGAAASVAAVVGMAQCPDVLAARANQLRPTWAAHWEYGRWLLATSGAFWCSGQAPAILASALLTPVAAAVIRACQYLVTPLNVTFVGLEGVFAPRASKAMAVGGERSLGSFLRILALTSAVAVLSFALILIPLTPFLLRMLYRGRYAAYSSIVAVLLLDALLSACSRTVILGLKVRGNTRSILIGYLWAAAAGLGALLLLAPTLGILGAAIAAPVSSAILLIYTAATLFSAPARIPVSSLEVGTEP